MKLITTTALALIAALSATPAAAQTKPAAPAQQQPEPKITPSKGATKALVDLQNAVNKKDYASVPALVAAAEAVAKTKEDHYLIAKFQLDAALGTNDKAAIAA